MVKIIRIKPISPSLREKKRYLTYEIISQNKLSFNEAKSSIDSANLRFLGELSMAKYGIIHLDELYHENKGVLKVNHKYVNELKTSLALIRQINNDKVIVNTINISGMINKSKKMLKKGG